MDEYGSLVKGERGFVVEHSFAFDFSVSLGRVLKMGPKNSRTRGEL